MLIVAAALAILAIHLNKKSVASILFRKNSVFLMSFQLTAAQSGVTIESFAGRSEIFWSGIEKVEMFGLHLYVFTSPSNAIIIPQFAFHSRTEFAEYAATFRRLWESRPA